MKHAPEVENLLKQACVLREMGRTHESLPLLERALATAPFDADMLCQLSLTYSEMGEWEKSLAAADKALATNPISEWAHRLRSTNLRALKRNKESLEAARDAAKYKPNHPFVLATLGYALLACKQVEEAEAIGLRMVEVAPESVKAHLLMAEVYAQQQRWAEVEQHARTALQVEAESDDAHRRLGDALSEQQQRWQAVQAYLLALRLNPMNHKARTRFQNQCLQIGSQLIPYNAISIGMCIMAFLLHRWILSGIAALLVSAGCAVLLTAFLAYQVPILLYLFQPEYRQLHVATRQAIVRQCRRNWLKAVGTITSSVLIGLLFLWWLLWGYS